MVKSLMKSPLTALFFAAVWCFAAVFPPVSELYSEVLAAFVTPKLGYAFMAAYGLFLSIIIALIFDKAKDKGIKIVIFTALVFIGTQWLTPYLQQIKFGEPSGTMTMMDTIYKAAAGAASTLLFVILAYLLFKAPPEPAAPVRPNLPHQQKPQPDKYKVKKVNFAIILIVLPIMYCILYFVVWFFVLWRVPEVREFYAWDSDVQTFPQAIVKVLLTDVMQIPVAFVKGILYSALMIPMLFQLAAKRVIFILTTVLIMLGVAVQMLIPNALMPWEVRFPHLIQLAIEGVAFGALASFMLHTCMYKVAAPHPVAAPLAAKAKPGAKAEAKAEAEPEAKAAGK